MTSDPPRDVAVDRDRLMRFIAHDEVRSEGRGRAPLLVLIAMILAGILGCGNGLANVTGNVTMDGQPLRGGSDVRATVTFQPLSGSGATAVGIVDENGKFSLSTGSQKGVAPGDYLVTCSATQIIPSKNPGGTPSGRRITPMKYADAKTSGLQFTVQPGGNEFNLPLSSAADGTASRVGT